MIDLDEKLLLKIKEIGLLPEEKIEMIRKLRQKEKKPVKTILLEKNLLSEREVGEIIADILGVKFVQLSRKKIPEDVLRIVPEVVARKQLIIAFQRDKEGVSLAMNDPTNLEIIEFIQKKTGEKVIPYYATEKDIIDSLSAYHRGALKGFDKIISESIVAAKGVQRAEEAPIVRIVDALLEYGYQNRASDIHIEPYNEFTLVRFRIDGVLHDIVKIPRELHDLIVMRIKILAKMKTDEHRMAQDGKLRFKLSSGERMDVRVSIVPLVRGEKVVMRLLLEKAGRYSLKNLGFLKNDLKKVKRAISKPWGMILATGPTGSGKTTTLYSILEILNRREVNISTIEDPVEYDIEGVNQIQVNPKTNLTFANGLRAIVRQDPDIIMVGEIRDEETAKIAVNAAMTGHLVLSTIHTNDAATTLPRLLQMGVPPFLVASTVTIAIAQRLVRKICPNCITSKELDEKTISLIKSQLSPDLIKKFDLDKKGKRVYYGKGCELCQQTGYKGRIGIFEVLEMTEEIKNMVINRANSDQIKAKAIEQGMTTMVEDGLTKVLQGLTTIEEVLRVTRE